MGIAEKRIGHWYVDQSGALACRSCRYGWTLTTKSDGAHSGETGLQQLLRKRAGG